MNLSDLPTLNALLNFASAALLLLGFISIRQTRRDVHKKLMLAALVCSLTFLISYSVYHANVGSVPYTRHDWTRPVYFVILTPHVALAGVILPFIIAAVWHAWHRKYDKHRRLVHWVWPTWMFVNFSGIIIYIMLYKL